MKLGPVTKRDIRKTATSKKLDDDILLANCDVLIYFVSCGQFGAI